MESKRMLLTLLWYYNTTVAFCSQDPKSSFGTIQ
jgi:hypothetical protein